MRDARSALTRHIHENVLGTVVTDANGDPKLSEADGVTPMEVTETMVMKELDLTLLSSDGGE